MMLSAPPRRAPLRVAAAMLFGGVFNQMGWGFFGFGMIFVWAFGGVSAISGIGAPELDEYGYGKVTSIERTGAEVNEERVFDVKFTYEVNGRTHAASSFTTDHYEIGDEVGVEYAGASPDVACIEGTRNSIFPWFVSLACGIFPLVGLILIVIGFRKGRRALHLVKHGVVAMGRLASKNATNSSVNEQPVYELTFTFEDDGGVPHQAVTRTHRTQSMEDEPEEPILYLREDPRVATPFDEWQDTLTIDTSGGLVPASATTGTLVLLVPALSIIGHGLVLVGAVLSALG